MTCIHTHTFLGSYYLPSRSFKNDFYFSIIVGLQCSVNFLLYSKVTQSLSLTHTHFSSHYPPPYITHILGSSRHGSIPGFTQWVKDLALPWSRSQTGPGSSVAMAVGTGQWL